MSEETKTTEQVKKVEEQKASESKTKKHPRLGEYKKVLVDWKQPGKNGTSIFVSINKDTFEFHPDTEVELPQAIIDFLKAATYPKHVYEGKKHTTKQVRKYSVEIV